MINPGKHIAVRVRNLTEFARTGVGSWADLFAQQANVEEAIMKLGAAYVSVSERLEEMEQAMQLQIPPMTVEKNVFESYSETVKILELSLGIKPPIWRIAVSPAQAYALSRDGDDKFLRRFVWRSYLGFCRHIRKELKASLFGIRDFK